MLPKRRASREGITFSTGRCLKDSKKRPATRTHLTPRLPTGHLPFNTGQVAKATGITWPLRKKAARFLKDGTQASLIGGQCLEPGTWALPAVTNQQGYHHALSLNFPIWKLTSSFLNRIPSSDGGFKYETEFSKRPQASRGSEHQQSQD